MDVVKVVAVPVASNAVLQVVPHEIDVRHELTELMIDIVATESRVEIDQL